MRCRRRRSAALTAVVVLAGCGDAQPPAQRPAKRPSGPCVEAARDMLSGARTRVTGVSPGAATCVYETAAVRADVTVDSNPQAATRFSRAVVERAQNAAWTHVRRKAPVLVDGVGQGADWFPADHELLATDGKRIVSVKFVRAGGRALATTLARATLAG
jgi:hypothetical protein